MEHENGNVGDLARKYTPSMFFRRVGFAVITINAIGAALCTFYFMIIDSTGLYSGLAVYPDVAFYTTVALIIFGIALSMAWRVPVVKCWQHVAKRERPDKDLLQKAQRKVVNAPFFFSMLSVFCWVVAALVLAGTRYHYYVAEKGDAGPMGEAVWVLIGVLALGCIATTVIFFYMDRVFMGMRSVFFTGGEIFELRRALRLPVRARLLVAMLMGGAFPLVALSAMVYRTTTRLITTNPWAIPSKVLYLMAFALVISLGLIWFLTNMVGISVAEPIERLRRAMGNVRRGDLDQAVPVEANDEVGYLADSFNKMLTSIELLHDLNRDIMGDVDLPGDLGLDDDDGMPAHK